MYLQFMNTVPFERHRCEPPMVCSNQSARTLDPYTNMATRQENKGQRDQKHPSDLHLKTFRLSTRIPK